MVHSCDRQPVVKKISIFKYIKCCVCRKYCSIPNNVYCLMYTAPNKNVCVNEWKWCLHIFLHIISSISPVDLIFLTINCQSINLSQMVTNNFNIKWITSIHTINLLRTIVSNKYQTRKRRWNRLSRCQLQPNANTMFNIERNQLIWLEPRLLGWNLYRLRLAQNLEKIS